MSANYKQFEKLHRQKNIFILPNAWDAHSALLMQKSGFKAIATSSWAVASKLGYKDGEQMAFHEYLFVINRIMASIRVPLSVDLEMGYGNTPAQIIDNIKTLADAGVAGINIEDSKITGSKRRIDSSESFAKKLEQIKNDLQSANSSIFLNVRCDAYLLNIKDKQKQSEQRIKLYENAGADGIFLPGITSKKDISEAVQHTRLPINVMGLKGLPDFETLNALGVKRVSMGPFLSEKVYSNITLLCEQINKDKNLGCII